jgi:hypothetical protein
MLYLFSRLKTLVGTLSALVTVKREMKRRMLNSKTMKHLLSKGEKNEKDANK